MEKDKRGDGMGGKSKIILKRYAKKCEKCVHDCKQPYFVVVVKCPFFERRKEEESEKDNGSNN